MRYKIIDLGEENSGEIITVPFMSKTVGQMLEDLMNGKPISGISGLYQTDEDEDIEPVRPIQDLTEIDNLKRDIIFKQDKYKKKNEQKETKESSEV